MELEVDWDFADFNDAFEVADEVGAESVALTALSLAEAGVVAGVGPEVTVEDCCEACDEFSWLEDMLGCLASEAAGVGLLSWPPSSSAVASSLELEAAAESLRLEIFILAVPLTTSMNLKENIVKSKLTWILLMPRN